MEFKFTYFFPFSLIFCVLAGLGALDLFTKTSKNPYLAVIFAFMMVTILAFNFYTDKVNHEVKK